MAAQAEQTGSFSARETIHSDHANGDIAKESL